MADFMSKETRSRVMSRIRSKNTKPEMAVRTAVHANGFRYSLHSKKLPGKPDLAFKKYKLAAFVHGCFWHGHTCGTVKLPSSNTGYWHEKIAKNQSRDEKALSQLKDMGWETVTIWECTIDKDLEELLSKLNNKRNMFLAISSNS